MDLDMEAVEPQRQGYPFPKQLPLYHRFRRNRQRRGDIIYQAQAIGIILVINCLC